MKIDSVCCQKVAEVMGQMAYLPDLLKGSPFESDSRREALFLFFMCAIDHKTHGKMRYEETVGKEMVHGSDLMVRKAAEAGRRNAQSWTCEGVGKLTEEKAQAIFSTVEGRVPVGLARRVELMQEAAKMLEEKYKGDVCVLFERAGNRLAGKGGALDRLAECVAFADPLEKKSQLLIKLLHRRSLVIIKDPENMAAPPDHVLMTLCLRSGLVRASEEIAAKIFGGERLSAAELWQLRQATREALSNVAQQAKLPVDHVDDLFWSFGRELLRLDLPIKKENLKKLKTPLDERCREAGREKFLEIMCGEGETALFPVPVYAETEFF